VNLFLLIHADPSVRVLYESALSNAGLEGWRVVPFVGPALPNVPGGGLSSRYAAMAASLSTRADRPTLLDALLAHPVVRAGARSDYERVVLASYSAGYSLLFALLSQAIDAALFIDSGHTKRESDGTADDEQLEPVVEFVKLARAGQRLCWFGHTSIKTPYASTTEVAHELVGLGGPPAGLWYVEQWPGADAEAHRRALRIYGPDFAARAIKALLGGVVLRRGAKGQAVIDLQRALLAAGHDPGPLDGIWGRLTSAAITSYQHSHGIHDEPDMLGPKTIAMLYGDRNTEPTGEDRSTDADDRGAVFPSVEEPEGLGVRALRVAIGELGQHEIEGRDSNPRIVEYIVGARRNGKPVFGVAVGDEPPWCACLVGWTEHQAAIEGETPPPWRVSVAEIWADAKKIGTTRPKDYTPSPGDLAIFRRGGGDPRWGGTGHVARVERVDGDRFWAIGGNEGGAAAHGGAVLRTERRLDDPDLVGWVAR
jgi:hypothetical protein